MTTSPAPPTSTRIPDPRSGADRGTQSGVLPRALVVLLGAASLVVVVAGIRGIAWLIGPVFLALIIVVTVAPVQGRLRRRGLPAWATTLVLVVCVYGVILAISLGVVFSVARLATELPRYAARSQALVASLTERLAQFGIGPEELRQAAESVNIGKLAGLLGALLSSATGLATNLVFLLALLLFLSVESNGTAGRLALIAADRPRVTEALTDFARGTRQYMLVTTVFGFIVAVLDTVALAIMGIPLPVTWGILAFITNYIPNVGFIIGVVPPALLGLVTGGPRLMVLVLVVYCVLNFVVQSIIQPRFIGEAVGLSVTVTFIALAFWAWLLGPLGAILAIPLTLMAKELMVDIDPRARWADALLGDSVHARAPRAGDATAVPPG